MQASAQTLVIQFSDSHSNYEQLNRFYRTVLQLGESFKQRHSRGTVIILANGDISGTSLWTRHDAGALSHRVLALLARRYQVVPVMGNHEAFDFVGSVHEAGMQPNELALRQGRTLVASLNGRKILAANIVTTPASNSIFGHYTEFNLNSGERLRVIGFLTPSALASSAYDTESPLQLIERLNPLIETAKSELINSKRAGVNQVILAFHEELVFLRPVLEQLYAWKNQQQELASLKILYSAAGHDHLVTNETVSNTPLIDAGSDYAFSAVTFGERFNYLNADHWSIERQNTLSLDPIALTAEENGLLESIDSEVALIRSENSRSLGRVLGTTQTKKDLEVGQQALGRAISNSVRDWAARVLRKEVQSPRTEAVLGFYNSTAYRLETPIAEGDLLSATVGSMVPFDMGSRAFVLTGRQILSMFRALRIQREKKQNYSPQLSSNLRETPDYGLEVLGRDGSWSRLREEAHYGLGMDYYLSRNGCRLPEFTEAFSHAHFIAKTTRLTREILAEYLPAHMGCGGVLE